MPSRHYVPRAHHGLFPSRRGGTHWTVSGLGGSRILYNSDPGTRLFVPSVSEAVPSQPRWASFPINNATRRRFQATVPGDGLRFCSPVVSLSKVDAQAQGIPVAQGG